MKICSGGKSFALRLQMEIHSMNSSERRLSQTGSVALRICTLSDQYLTQGNYPVFPLHFHETAIFQKVIDGVSDLSQVQDRLDEEFLEADLLQLDGKWRIIAHFREKLSNVLFQNGGKIKLLMEPEEKFAVEISTKVIVEEKKDHVGSVTKVSDNCVLRTLTECECHSVNNINWRHSTGNDCSICNFYTGYFHPKCSIPIRMHSSPDRCGRKRTIPYRQLFYENLENFYRELREKRKIVLNAE